MLLSDNKRPLNFTLQLLAISYGLNLFWESAHSSLFQDMPPFLYHFPFLMIAALGDVFLTLIILLLTATAHRRFFWYLDHQRRDLPALLVISIAISLGIEYLNVSILHRWSYTSHMPLLPYLDVGLTPFLQIALLPLAALWLASRFFACSKRVLKRMSRSENKKSTPNTPNPV